MPVILATFSYISYLISNIATNPIGCILEHKQDQITSLSHLLSHLDHCNSCLPGFSAKIFTSSQVRLHTAHKMIKCWEVFSPCSTLPFQPSLCLGPGEFQSLPSSPSPHSGQQLLVSWAQGLGGLPLSLSSLRLGLSPQSLILVMGLVMLSSWL